MIQKFVSILLFCGMSINASVYGHTRAETILGRECAKMYALLQDDTFCNDDFLAFLELIMGNQDKLSLQDWETISILTKQYIHRSIKLGAREQAIQSLKRLIMLVHIPKKVRQELSQSYQKLNPRNLIPTDLFNQLFHDDVNHQDPFLRVYSMALYSNYESQKQAILFAKEQKNFTEAISLCSSLLYNLDQEKCVTHPDLADIEKCFLEKTMLILRIEDAKSKNFSYEHWFAPYFEAEEAYMLSIEKLIARIANQEVERSQEVDAVLLSHALSQMTSNVSAGIKELNVLIGYGKFLHSNLAQYAYFFLLETYYQNQQLSEIGGLLEFGRSVFKDQHPYEPEYMFFLGAYLYHQHQYDKAKQAFSVVLNHATRLGVSLARTYEYLGCIAYQENNFQEAKKYFLQAYKGCGFQDSQLGLFLASAKLNEIVFCNTLLSNSSLSIIHSDLLKKINALFLSTSPETHSYVFQIIALLNKGEPVSQEIIYNYILLTMMHSDVHDMMRPVLSLIHHEVQNREKEVLRAEILQRKNSYISEALSVWLAYMEGRLPILLANQKKGETDFVEKLLLICYDAMHLGSNSAIDMLPKFFSSQHSHLQSTLRLIWLQTRQGGTHLPEGFSDSLFVRLHGDRLYFFSYTMEDYLTGQKDALAHLELFPEYFPSSPLLPIAYYFLGLSECSLLSKVHWLKKASEEFAMVPISSIHAKTWACIYYDLHLDLAEIYFALGDAQRAQQIFEDLKEDWLVSSHPRLSLVPEGQYRSSLEARILLGLARVYHHQKDYDQMKLHIFDYLRHRWIFSKYLQEDLKNQLFAEFRTLCACFSQNADSYQ